MKNLTIVLIGAFFGIILTKGEINSWLRIYEMFHFKSFHMYGIIGAAVILGAILFQIIKKKGIKNIDGSPIEIAPKPKNYKSTLIGGTIFGLGWAMTGACPGPLFNLIGAGEYVFIVSVIAALLGAFTYGVMKKKLPH